MTPETTTLPTFRARELVKLAEDYRRMPSTDKAARLALKVVELFKQAEHKEAKQEKLL